MGMSLVTIFEILHHIALLFFRTGAKSLATVRRTMTITSIHLRSREATSGHDENGHHENGHHLRVDSCQPPGHHPDENAGSPYRMRRAVTTSFEHQSRDTNRVEAPGADLPVTIEKSIDTPSENSIVTSPSLIQNSAASRVLYSENNGLPTTQLSDSQKLHEPYQNGACKKQNLTMFRSKNMSIESNNT